MYIDMNIRRCINIVTMYDKYKGILIWDINFNQCSNTYEWRNRKKRQTEDIIKIKLKYIKKY